MIYWDNNATTPLAPEVYEAMEPFLKERFFNPSAGYGCARHVREAVEEARAAVAALLGAFPSEIVFTSGGTESNNLAIIGTALANQRAGRHIITTSVEHASVKNTMRFLEEEGFEITYLPVDANGEISLEDLKRELREDTILVSMMMVNNEIGALEPIENAGEIIKNHNPATVFHVDAIQAYGKFQIIPKRMHIDLLSVSGHKIHGPKGIGFLYMKEKTKIRPISFGGDQQRGMRSGTINVPGIAGLGVAAAEAYAHLADNAEHMYELKSYFADKLQQIGDVTINGKVGHDSAPQIISASFLGVRSEVLLHSLEDRCIYVSAGSACSSNHPSQSGTLLNIGLDHAHQESTLRFSFCPETTREELDYTYGVLEELLPMLRRYTRH